MKKHLSSVFLFFLAFFVGCYNGSASEYQNNLSTGSYETSGMMETGDTDESGTSSGDTDSDTGDTDGETVFDLAWEEDDTLCEKVDFLFVIDNSGSMSSNQANLIANYQVFIDGIKGLTGSGNFHIGVITTDGYISNGANCGVMGGLVNQTFSETCGPWSEGNFMTLEEIDLENGFECAALVGTSGSGSERQAEALLASMRPYLSSPGQCNEGFFREDAKLIVTFITDEEDKDSPGSPYSWINEVEYYRSLDDIVVLGLIPMPESECAYSSSTRLKDFILSFPDSFLGDVCAEDYSQFFSDAISTIESSCNPVG